MKKQKENSLENITWSEMGQQNVQAKEVYSEIENAVFSQRKTPWKWELEKRFISRSS